MTSALAHSPVEIVRLLLVAGGQAADPDVVDPNGIPTGKFPAYNTVEPDVPDACITVQGSTGQSDGRDMDSGALNTHYGIQLRIRARDSVEGFNKAQSLRTWISESVYQALVTANEGGLIGTYNVNNFSKIGDVNELGVDAPSSKRWLYTINCFISVRQIS